MLRKLFWLVVTIGISAAFIFGYEAFLMDSFTAWLAGISPEMGNNASSGVLGKINPVLAGIVTAILFFAKAFFAYLGIRVANLIFSR